MDIFIQLHKHCWLIQIQLSQSFTVQGSKGISADGKGVKNHFAEYYHRFKPETPLNNIKQDISSLSSKPTLSRVF
ncbi:MAG: hypothetical protein KAI17_11555 [Thiotrichaceae bacterium]|nr:hypothetical protein [Thiotrichaceae bacterium]